jgi:hypothetical protein
MYLPLFPVFYFLISVQIVMVVIKLVNVTDACNNFGLIISTKITELMHCSALGMTNIYLSSILSWDIGHWWWVQYHTLSVKASVSFGRLYKNMWDRRGITTDSKVKVKVCRVTVLITVLCGCELWTQCRVRKLNRFHNPSFRQCYGIKWQEKTPPSILKCWWEFV